jgi:hypothetical protein
MFAGFRSRCNDVPLVCIFQGLGNLAGDGQRLFQPNRALSNALRQRWAVHQFHHQGAVFHTLDGGDTGVVQRRQDPSLLLKAGYAVAVLREGFRQDLDGHIAIELGIGGAPDLSR